MRIELNNERTNERNAVFVKQ